MEMGSGPNSWKTVPGPDRGFYFTRSANTPASAKLTAPTSST
jgi:hypothetical protein